MPDIVSVEHNNNVPLSIVIGAILIFIGIAYFVGIVMRQIYLIPYNNRGKQTEATVIDKYTKESGIFKQYYIDYRFEYQSNDGNPESFLRRKDNVGKEFYEQVAEGSSIKILYLTDNLNNAEIESLIWRPNSNHTIRGVGFFIGGIVVIILYIYRKRLINWLTNTYGHP